VLPTAKLPLLDWTTMNLRYQAGYRWIGASRLAVELGNFLENGQQKEATIQLDFNRLYQKSKYLRQLDSLSPFISHSSLPIYFPWNVYIRLYDISNR
jgi:cell surface protein SprA